MSEIDFDELDKAVNSIMGQPADISTAATQTKPAVDSNDSPSQPSPQTPAVKRRGQFMDMIHPSAKMRSVEPSAPRPRVSRQGATIAPGLESSAMATDQAIDQSSTQKPLETLSSIAPSAGAPDSTGSAVSPTLHQAQEPQTSPFLADAKVDKRPLGSPDWSSPTVSSTDLSSQMADLNQNLTSESQSDQSSADDDNPTTTPLPAELSQDIMQIESDGATKSPEPAIVTTSNEIANSSSQAAIGARQLSIPPQYKAATPKVPLADSENQPASMYDLGDGPLKAPVKKKSSWPIIIGALLLILVGIVGSVGLFLLNHS